jgi:hypothetical protein
MKYHLLRLESTKHVSNGNRAYIIVGKLIFNIFSLLLLPSGFTELLAVLGNHG